MTSTWGVHTYATEISQNQPVMGTFNILHECDSQKKPKKTNQKKKTEGRTDFFVVLKSTGLDGW